MWLYITSWTGLSIITSNVLTFVDNNSILFLHLQLSIVWIICLLHKNNGMSHLNHLSNQAFWPPLLLSTGHKWRKCEEILFCNCYYHPTRNLHPVDAGLLMVHIFSKSSMGGRAFSCPAPLFWYHLPVTVRRADTLSSLKSSLKVCFLRKLIFTVGLSSL